MRWSPRPTAQKQAAITVAEGNKQSAILNAEGDRQAAILRAEGFALALTKIFESAQGVDAKTMSLQYLDALKQIGAVALDEVRDPDGVHAPALGYHRLRRADVRQREGRRRSNQASRNRRRPRGVERDDRPSGGPSTGGRRARTARAGRRRCGLRRARGAVPGGGVPHRMADHAKLRRGRGRRTGGVREGVLRARPVPGRRGVPAVGPSDRFERGEEPAAVGGPARAAHAAARAGPRLGGRGPVPRDRGPGPRGAGERCSRRSSVSRSRSGWSSPTGTCSSSPRPRPPEPSGSGRGP